MNRKDLYAMEKQKDQFLTKRVLLSLCTAGVLALSLPNMASAADGDYQIWNDTPGTTKSYSDDTVTQTGETEAVNSGGGIIALTNYTINGQIWSGNHGEVNITGGTISSEKLPSSLLNEPLIQANQASISLSGVTVNASNMASDGKHILAENGGKITIESSTVYADIASSGKDSAITVKDSAMFDAYAYGGGTITAEGSDFKALIAGQYIVNGNSPQVVGSGSIKLTGGSVKDYIFATDGGTVETAGSTVNISNAAAFNGGSISISGTAEDAKAIVTVRGDGDSDDIQPSTLYAYNKGQIAMKNVNLTMTDITATPSADMDKTFIHAEGAGSKITLENVTATLPSAGSDEPEIFAEKGGRIELIKADFSSGSGDVAAKGSGSSVAITDSKVADLEAYEGGAITVKNSTVEAVHAGQHGDVAEYTAGTIDITGGEITDYVSVGGPGVVTITDTKLTGATRGGDHGIVDAHSGGTLVLRGSSEMTLAGSGFGAIESGIVRIEGGTYGAGSSYSSNGTYDATKNVDMQLITQTNGKIQLQGGKLYAHDFSKLQDKSLVLSGSGELVTTSGHVFEHGIDGANLPNVDDAKKWAANATDAGTVYNQKIDFQGGKLGLDDAFYTKAYVDSALQALHAVSDNKSQLDLFGTMIDANGTVVTEIAVDQVPDGAHLRNVTGTTDGKDLVIGTDTSGNAMVISGNIGLKNLDLGSAQNVTINNGQSLALYTGNDKGELVASTGGDATITVGEDSGTAGTLILGGDGNAAANQGSLSGTVNVTNGELKVVNGAYTIGTLKSNDPNNMIYVGSGQHKASLVVEKAALGGATLFLDPAWNGSDRIDDASSAALVFENSTGVRDHVDGQLVVGQNSILSLGTTDKTLAKKAFTRTGLQWGENGVTAALYVDTQQTFDATGNVFVDGTLTNPSPLTENFAANSLLIVNGAKINGDTAAFTGTKTIAIDSKANLYIADMNVAAGGEATYRIFDDAITLSPGSENFGNIITNALSSGKVNDDDKKSVTIKRDKASQVYSGIALANTLDAINIDTASSNAGEAYLSRFLEGKAYKDASVAQNVNAAAQLAQTVGITKTSIDATQSIADTVTQRLSLAAEPEEGRAHEFWVKYIHDDTDVDSLSLAGGLEAKYDSSYNGFILGMDFVANENRTSGAAFSYGSGDSSSAYASNDFDFWGLTYYNAVKKDDKNFIWDVGYSNTDHDVKGMELNASPDTDIFTVGMRGERVIQHSKSRIVPYIGLRYMNVDTGSYSGNWNGRSVLQYDAEKQNIWLLPIGVNFSREKTTKNGWTWRPSVDLSYVFNFGDHDDDMTVRVPGLSASDSFSYDVTDEGAFVAKVGLEGLRDNWSMGIGYTRQQGSDSHSDRFYANISFKF